MPTAPSSAQRGLIDPAEALWQAAQASPERRPVLVWGYPRLGRDEVAFIDAVAGEGSVVRLPYAEDHTFDENRETAEELERRGWTIERTPPQAAWDAEVACRSPRLPPPRGRGTGGPGPGQGPPRRRRPSQTTSCWWRATTPPTGPRCSPWRGSTAYLCKPSTGCPSPTRGSGTG